MTGLSMFAHKRGLEYDFQTLSCFKLFTLLHINYGFDIVIFWPGDGSKHVKTCQNMSKPMKFRYEWAKSTSIHQLWHRVPSGWVRSGTSGGKLDAPRRAKGWRRATWIAIGFHQPNCGFSGIWFRTPKKSISMNRWLDEWIVDLGWSWVVGCSPIITSTPPNVMCVDYLSL